MEINFIGCEEIDQKLYEKCILNYIYQHYQYRSRKDSDLYIKQDKWKIDIYNLDLFEDNFYTKEQRLDLSSGIPHGVTGKDIVKCYIIDKNNDLFTIQNFSAICHELGHMILYNIYGNQRSVLRHSDFFSRAGESKNFASQEIHDRIFERKLRTVTVKKNAFQRFRFIGVDILDLCK